MNQLDTIRARLSTPISLLALELFWLAFALSSLSIAENTSYQRNMAESGNDALNMSIDQDSVDPHDTKHHLSPTDRPFLKQVSTPATSCMSQDSSPSISSRTLDTSIDADSQNNQPIQRSNTATGKHTVWMPMPSPRRPRLDPRYASRLAPTPHTFWSQPSPKGATTVASTPDAELTNPPTITRDSADIFRPTPILTNMDMNIEQSYVEAGSQDLTVDSHVSHPFSPAAAATTSSMDRVAILSTPRRAAETEVTSDVGMSDRFIASRATSNLNMNLWDNSVVSSTPRSEARRNNSGSNGNNNTSTSNDDGDNPAANNNSNGTTGGASQQNFLNTLLRSELLGENDVSISPAVNSATVSNQRQGATQTPRGVSHLRFTSPRQVFQENVYPESVGPVSVVNSFSLTPVRSAASQRLMAAPPKRKRRISKVPFKVLDAPALQDDFYLNLVDWSSQNVLAVGLGSCVYLWSACTSKVTKLCDLEGTDDVVTSVAWAQRGTHLAVGTNRGDVQLWDTIQTKKLRSMAGHSSRVGALAWTGPVMASGSRDRAIYLRDVRVGANYTDKLTNHKQEVCGLKWSYDEPAFLASGGNDNHLHVIDSRHPGAPVHKFTEHTAAVKAITWSPHQHGLLASGGGTADRCIRFWNTLSGVGLNKIDTGSQVCNIAWSRNCNEIVSTHGYSLHQIVVWRYPSMTKVTTLTGHTFRVLYLAMSPDGSTVVTGAGDETLRFWQIFPGPRSGDKDGSGGLLFPKTPGAVIR